MLTIKSSLEYYDPHYRKCHRLMLLFINRYKHWDIPQKLSDLIMLTVSKAPKSMTKQEIKEFVSELDFIKFHLTELIKDPTMKYNDIEASERGWIYLKDIICILLKNNDGEFKREDCIFIFDLIQCFEMSTFE